MSDCWTPGTASVPMAAVWITSMVTLRPSLLAPPVPVLPKSLTFSVRVSLARGVPLLLMYLTELLEAPLSKPLIWASVPVKVTVPVPDPPTVTPVPPATTVIMPRDTLKVA